MKIFLNYIINLILKTFYKKKYYERSPSNAIKPYMKRYYKRISQNEFLVTPYTDGVNSYTGTLEKMSYSIKKGMEDAPKVVSDFQKNVIFKIIRKDKG